MIKIRLPFFTRSRSRVGAKGLPHSLETPTIRWGTRWALINSRFNNQRAGLLTRKHYYKNEDISNYSCSCRVEGYS